LVGPYINNNNNLYHIFFTAQIGPYLPKHRTKKHSRIKTRLVHKRRQNLENNMTTSKFLLILFGGMLIGWQICSFMNTSLYPNDYSSALLGPYNNNNNNNNGDDEATEKRMKRFWKYYETYQYIPPASRYDYVPVPAKECGTGPDYASWWQLDKMQRSRLSEDKFIYETFFKKHHAADAEFKGTYVELGAFDGLQESNSHFFDKCLGWKGLLMEGNPVIYQKTIQNRRYAHKMSMAPSCSDEYEAVNKTIPFYTYPLTNVGLAATAKVYTGKPTVDVPCGRLSPILEDIFAENKHSSSSGGGGGSDVALPTLDFFSLDVEGAEYMVLSTINFRAIRINILMIEISNKDCKNDSCKVRQQVRAKMATEGYLRYQNLVHASDIYVHPESPFQIST